MKLTQNRTQRAEAYALGTACTLAGREMSSMPSSAAAASARASMKP